jgi:CDP-2,3-bis-(O-geranylgeranyl)-sn-glycerol synthase
MLPAYFANMAPVLTKNGFKELKIPIDFNLKFEKQPIFGKHKTFRGLIFGTIFAIAISFIQYSLHNAGILTNLELFDYSNWLTIGFLLGFGAILGDLAKSFFKRRLDIKPGRPFIPFDQLDFVIGSLLLVYPFVELSPAKIALIIVLSFFLHIIINHLAFYTKVRAEKW